MNEGTEAMRDYAFYDAGGSEASRVQRFLVPLRRLVRFLLKPIFFRLEEILHRLDHDRALVTHAQQQLAGEVGQLPSTLRSELSALRKELQAEFEEQQAGIEARHRERLEGLEDDHLAAMRRLAVLEDELETLRQRRAA